MPTPLLGLATLIVLYIFCLALSFLVSLVYSKRLHDDDNEPEIAASKPPDDKVFYFERVTRRRRRKKNNETIAIRGKIIDENDKTSS